MAEAEACPVRASRGACARLLQRRWCTPLDASCWYADHSPFSSSVSTDSSSHDPAGAER